MWILYAFGSALFAGLTAVLAKCGIRKLDGCNRHPDDRRSDLFMADGVHRWLPIAAIAN